jgi:hypothetical protein
MEQLLQSLKERFPDLLFVAGRSFCWSPATQQIYYSSTHTGPSAAWSLLHETAHALLKHTAYNLDFELLTLEIAAWQKAKELSKEFSLGIDDEHIESCLDSYRDWLYRRSVCPSCGTQTLQLDTSNEYRCFNCRTSWLVAPSRFCRPYRQTSQIKSPVSF